MLPQPYPVFHEDEPPPHPPHRLHHYHDVLQMSEVPWEKEWVPSSIDVRRFPSPTEQHVLIIVVVRDTATMKVKIMETSIMIEEVVSSLEQVFHYYPHHHHHRYYYHVEKK
jgi:hypothetical protein